MFELYMDVTAISLIIMAVIAIPVLIPLLLIQHYIYKKIFDFKYFNNMHFSEGELVIFTSGWIFYISKATLYIRAIVFPKTMRVRFKENILIFKDHPVVYLLACFTMLLIVLGALGVINLFIFFGFWEYYS